MVSSLEDKTTKDAPKAEPKAEPKVEGARGPQAPLFTFVGDPNDDLSGPTTLPFSIVKDGVTKKAVFTKGEAQRVDDPDLAAKLRRHSHFVEGNDKAKLQPHLRQVETLRAQCDARRIPFDRHDGVNKLKERLGQQV